MLRQAPLTNRAISGQYPPGSTLKPFVGAIALQEGVIAPDTRLRDPGVLKLIERNGAPFELPNSIRNRDNGELTVIDALRLSSNVFFASVAGGNDQATNLDARALRIRGLDIDRLVQGLEWFHLGRITGIDLAGEAPGLVPTKTWKAQAKREVWTTGDTYNTAIGQGDMLVTPLQLAVAAGASPRTARSTAPTLSPPSPMAAGPWCGASPLNRSAASRWTYPSSRLSARACANR